MNYEVKSVDDFRLEEIPDGVSLYYYFLEQSQSSEKAKVLFDSLNITLRDFGISENEADCAESLLRMHMLRNDLGDVPFDMGDERMVALINMLDYFENILDKYRV